MALRLFRVAGPLLGSLRREASWRPGTYLTDGRRLFLMVSPLTPPAVDGLAELEDCDTGHRLLYTARDLWMLWLQPLPRSRTIREHNRRRGGATALERAHSRLVGL